MITVPQGGSIAGRSADIRIERPDIGGFVAEAASAVAEKMGKIVATQRAVKYSQTELAMTKELGTEYQRVAQYTDPAQIEAEWPQIEAGIRDKYVNAKDENGKPLLTPDEADTLGLQLGGLSVKHGFNLGARAIELTDSQAKAAWDTARLDIVNTAATADPDTMGALIELGEAAIDRLPGILPDEAVKQKQEFRAGVANARVIAAIDQDPLAAVAALKAGTYDDLGAEAVAQRIVTAQAEADRRAAAAATAGEAEAKKRTDAIGKDLDTMTTLFGKGVKVAQEDLLNDPAYKAHPKYPEAVAARDLAREVPNIRQMTPTQLDAEIAKEKAKPKDAAYQTERLTVLQTWRDEAVTALDTDPKAALTTAGLPAPAIPAFDPADTAPFTAALAESISFDEFQRGKGYTDKSAIFSKGDKTALQAVLAPGADAGPKVALLTAIETGSNGKAGEVLAALEADPVTRRTAKVLRVTRDPGLAEAILRGGQKLDGKTVVPPSRKDQVMAFDALTGGVFDDQPALKAELMEATLALYADNARGIDGETQSTAGDWLAERAEGGFSREVLSHFIFVLQRVLGPATVLASQPTYPADGRSAETALRARLQAGGIPIEVEAAVAGTLDDFNRLSLRGSTGELELRDWFGAAQRRNGQEWQGLGNAADLRAQGQDEQLTQWVALIEGRAHTLPGFAEALAVQETIERLLAGA